MDFIAAGYYAGATAETVPLQQSAGAMKVYVHGNCQSYVVAGMLGEIYPSWDIRYFEVHARPIIDQNEEYRQVVAAADLILAQPIHDGFRSREDLSLTWVREAAKPSAVVTVFPSMHFVGHQSG